MKTPHPKHDPAWWNKVSAADFRGDSHFREWTPVQKLMWLSQLQRFVATARGAARKKPAR